MTPTDKHQQVALALDEAHRAHLMSLLWWVAVPLICGAYMVVSEEPIAERVMFSIIAGVSFIANAVTYASKQKAAEAKAAGYENP